MRAVTIEITGHPVAKGRGRAAVVKGKARIFTPAKTRRWEEDARMVARQVMAGEKPIDGPLRCRIEAIFSPAASWPTWKQEAAKSGEIAHTSKPDVDNITKAAKDAMNGIVWLDDAQVAELAVSKRFGDTPMVRVTVEPLGNAAAQITRRDQLHGKTPAGEGS